MIVMIDASTHTIQLLWTRAKLLMEGDEINRAYAAGMREVLHGLGVIDHQSKPGGQQ